MAASWDFGTFIHFPPGFSIIFPQIGQVTIAAFSISPEYNQFIPEGVKSNRMMVPGLWPVLSTELMNDHQKQVAQQVNSTLHWHLKQSHQLALLREL